ncbi:hypothetical protein K6Y79_38690, partial [Burkholderia cenocepacia]|nr:hypothetical protein [Burkholderia cenocepacia]
AASVTLALVSTQIIASIYDFYHIPGDSDHMIFYTLAMFSWSYMSVSLYFAYCALERAQEDEIKINRRYAVGTMHRHQN